MTFWFKGTTRLLVLLSILQFIDSLAGGHG
jgi:hypothetical protein